MSSGPIDRCLRAREAGEDRVGALVTERRSCRADLKQGVIPRTRDSRKNRSQERLERRALAG